MIAKKLLQVLKPPAAVSSTGDPYFSAVSLLLHMDGSNGSTTFTDSSSNAFSVTAAGNAQISTSSPKFGTGSALFDGNSDYLQNTSSNIVDFGSGDFTVECWINLASVSSSQTLIYGTASGGFFMRVGTGYLSAANGLNIGKNVQADNEYCSYTFSTNTWYHIAVTRQGSTVRFFVDGTQYTTNGSGYASYSVPNSSTVRIGGSAAEWFNGKIDDLRVTKGIARYTSNFTPPTAAFPDLYNPYTTLPVSGAALWLDASQQSSLFTDAGATNVNTAGQSVYQWNDLSGNNRHATQTTSGNRPTWVAPASGRNGFGAVAFNGSQWLSLGYSITGNFTIFVVYKNNDTVNGSVILGKSTTTSNYIYVLSNSLIQMNGGGSQEDSDSRTNGTQWDYSTFKYDGTNLTAYSADSSGSPTNVGSTSFTPDRIGYYLTSQYSMDGNIAEIIIYPSALSDTDRLSVRNYLKTKWGF